MRFLTCALCGGLGLAACAPTSQPPVMPSVTVPIVPNIWNHQEQSGNIQVWDQLAGNVADEIQARGLLWSTPIVKPDGSMVVPPVTFHVSHTERTPFESQVAAALVSQLLKRNARVTDGYAANYSIVIGSSVVHWRSKAEDDQFGTAWEGMLQATVRRGGEAVIVSRQPFYLYGADLPLYVANLPPPPPPPPMLPDKQLVILNALR